MHRILLVALIAGWTTGCVMVQSPISGGIYNNSKGPTIIGSGEAGSKTGTACSKAVVGFVSGDSSIEAAKAQGGISKVTYVDHTVKSVLAVYVEYCTLVHGD